MRTIQFVLLLLAFIFFVLAAFNVNPSKTDAPKIQFAPLGLALWALSVLIATTP